MKNNNYCDNEDFYKGFEEFKGLPVVTDFRLLPKDNKELKEIIYDLSMQALFLETLDPKFDYIQNIIIVKSYTKNVKTFLCKKGEDWTFLRVFW